MGPGPEPECEVIGSIQRVRQGDPYAPKRLGLAPGGRIRLPGIRPNRSNRPSHGFRRSMVASLGLRRDLIAQDRGVALESLDGSHDSRGLRFAPGVIEDLLTERRTRRGPAGWMERKRLWHHGTPCESLGDAVGGRLLKANRIRGKRRQRDKPAGASLSFLAPPPHRPQCCAHPDAGTCATTCHRSHRSEGHYLEVD